MKLDNYECEGQMDIFDFLKTGEDWEEMPEEEVVKTIGERVGVGFKWNAFLGQWEGKVGKVKLDVSFSHFKGINDDRKFISSGWSVKNGGGGSPCESIDESVRFLRAAIERGKGEK